MQANLQQVVQELERLQQQEKARNEQISGLKAKLEETLKILASIPATPAQQDKERISQLEGELFISDDTRLKVQQKLNEKMSEADDLQDQIQLLKHKIQKLEQDALLNVADASKEKITDLEQQLIQSDQQRQKFASQLQEKVAQIDDMADQIEALKKENEHLKAVAKPAK